VSEDQGFTTRAVHRSRSSETVVEEPASIPIYQAAPFIFSDMERFAAVGKA
jgi:O-acetylhomoserine/O-acetylserine sulfhydrylase-like pyridoxal-dependent enzyme